jgi:hypothetical protein
MIHETLPQIASLLGCNGARRFLLWLHVLLIIAPPNPDARAFTNSLTPFAHNQTAVVPLTRGDGYGLGWLLRPRRGSDPLKVQSTIMIVNSELLSKLLPVNR